MGTKTQASERGEAENSVEIDSELDVTTDPSPNAAATEDSGSGFVFGERLPRTKAFARFLASYILGALTFSIISLVALGQGAGAYGTVPLVLATLALTGVWYHVFREKTRF